MCEIRVSTSINFQCQICLETTKHLYCTWSILFNLQCHREKQSAEKIAMAHFSWTLDATEEENVRKKKRKPSNGTNDATRLRLLGMFNPLSKFAIVEKVDVWGVYFFSDCDNKLNFLLGAWHVKRDGMVKLYLSSTRPILCPSVTTDALHVFTKLRERSGGEKLTPEVPHRSSDVFILSFFPQTIRTLSVDCQIAPDWC